MIVYGDYPNATENEYLAIYQDFEENMKVY